jgi:hypothetical protein
MQLHLVTPAPTIVESWAVVCVLEPQGFQGCAGGRRVNGCGACK